MHKSVEDMAKEHNMTVEEFQKAVEEEKLKYPARFIRITPDQPSKQIHKY